MMIVKEREPLWRPRPNGSDLQALLLSVNQPRVVILFDLFSLQIFVYLLEDIIRGSAPRIVIVKLKNRQTENYHSMTDERYQATT